VKSEGPDVTLASRPLKEKRYVEIAVSSNGNNLQSEVDPRFGRCRYFIIVDPQTMEFEALENSAALAGGGAGIAAAQTLNGKGIEVVLTGNCGPNAFQVPNRAGMKVVTGASGTVEDAVTSYGAGNLAPTSQPNVAPHFGMGRK
jgi:predicted Fe-Mo cluster-binding NifX family protein